MRYVAMRGLTPEPEALLADRPLRSGSADRADRATARTSYIDWPRGIKTDTAPGSVPRDIVELGGARTALVGRASQGHRGAGL